MSDYTKYQSKFTGAYIDETIEMAREMMEKSNGGIKHRVWYTSLDSAEYIGEVALLSALDGMVPPNIGNVLVGDPVIFRKDNMMAYVDVIDPGDGSVFFSDGIARVGLSSVCSALEGVADWCAPEGELGHVKNRTHWVEEVSKAGVVLSETTITFATTLAALPGVNYDVIVAGRPYKVTWGGVDYNCRAVLLYENRPESVALGNLSLLGEGDDTEEPFVLSGSPVVFRAKLRPDREVSSNDKSSIDIEQCDQTFRRTYGSR